MKADSRSTASCPIFIWSMSCGWILTSIDRSSASGTISRLAADLTQDQKTGIAYYTARIETSEMELERLKDLKLVPGMPVEAFVQTGERTALSYLVKPFTDSFQRAMRED